jgi:hypothetical protein
MTSTLQYKATASSSPLQDDFLVQGDFLDAVSTHTNDALS